MIRRRWPLLVILLLLGGLAGILLAPSLFNPDETPPRLRSKKASSKQRRVPGEVYRSKNVRVRFRRKEARSPEDEIIDFGPSDDGRPRY